MIEMASAIGNRWIPVTKPTVLGVGWHAMNIQYTNRPTDTCYDASMYTVMTGVTLTDGCEVYILFHAEDII